MKTVINAEVATATTLHRLAAALQGVTGWDGPLAMGVTLLGLGLAGLVVLCVAGKVLSRYDRSPTP
jgi:hypothetical protein